MFAHWSCSKCPGLQFATDQEVLDHELLNQGHAPMCSIKDDEADTYWRDYAERGKLLDEMRGL